MESLWPLLIMHDVDGKQLRGIKSIYLNNLACMKVKGFHSESLLEMIVA